MIVPRPDRYKSFSGIDCIGDSRRLITRIRCHIDDPAKTDAFWEMFKSKLAQVGDTRHHGPDELHIVCSYIAYIGELFERYGDADGLALLQRLEEECC